MPYLIFILLGGILHNRIWLKKNDQQLSVPLPYDRQLHMPNIRQMLLQMWQNIQMFIVQALPIFITICLIVSILSLTPILNVLSQIFTPILSLLGISSELSPGILFSMIRKDGMLLFNLHQGALLQGMTATQLLLLVFFSSTFTACSGHNDDAFETFRWSVSTKINWKANGDIIVFSYWCRHHC